MNRAIYYLALVTVVATWILLLIGGLVNPMGASLACPDWYFVPTCNGEVFPKMQGGVLFEHGHRLWASLVGLLTLVLAMVMSRSKSVELTTKKLGFLALFLVVLQGTFGGVTVLLGLSAVLSTLHLVTAMCFFCLLIYIAFRLSPKDPTATLPSAIKVSPRAMFGVTLFILLQILLGGLVRHFGAGMACGDDLLRCGPELWPHWHLGQLHMLHRFTGYVVFVVLLVYCVRIIVSANDVGHRGIRLLGLAPLVLVVLQIFLGLWTVASIRQPVVVAFHTAIGSLLLATVFLLFLLLSKVSHTQNQSADR